MTTSLSPPVAVLIFFCLVAMFAGATVLDNRFPMGDLLGRVFKRLRRPVGAIEGYQDPELIDVIYRKTLKYEPTEPWPEMSGVSSVLDFGGGCGIHYKQAINSAPGIRWAVVETPAMVNRASALETQHLRFFSDIDAAASWLGSVEVVHSNGALQYADDPIQTVKRLCALGARKLLWRRLFLGDGGRKTQVSRLEDNGPGKMKTAHKTVSYEHTTIQEDKFLALHVGYRLEERGSDWFNFVR